jgi:hypothetical protein
MQLAALNDFFQNKIKEGDNMGIINSLRRFAGTALLYCSMRH